MRILRLPAKGRLLFCTDLHGNLRDFRRMRTLFLESRNLHGQTILLFCGDLVHGPCYERDDWPDYLGSYYVDQSGPLVQEFLELQQAYPNDVHALLGNHEHSHIGGPHTPKFWQDETAYFEQTIGSERTRRYLALFRSFPLIALSHCGVAFTHAAPNVEISNLEEIEEVRYEGHENMNLIAATALPLIGRLLWSRRCSDENATNFLSVISEENAHHVVAFGHDIAAEGVECFGKKQLMLSTSFGLFDEEKLYLELDLASTYRTTDDFRSGTELKKLY